MLRGRPAIFVVAVYLPETGELSPFEFRESELNLSEDALVAWVDEHGASKIAQHYGASAIGVGLWDDNSGGPSLKCPKCGCETIRIETTGFAD
jgi:hypothetical protein